jgi:hypothetical protein
MGISIHFSGMISDPSKLSALVEEIEEIAQVHHWDYAIENRQFPDADADAPLDPGSLYGISFTPHHCETISFCFLSDGRMSSPINIQVFGAEKNPRYRESMYLLSVKTQSAGLKIHQFIIHLFKYLEKKYLRNFKLRDEGEYWETMDELVLKRNFQYSEQIIAGSAPSGKTRADSEEDEVKDYLMRIIKQIKSGDDQNSDNESGDEN